jgi:hypothetical protein
MSGHALQYDKIKVFALELKSDELIFHNRFIAMLLILLLLLSAFEHMIFLSPTALVISFSRVPEAMIKKQKSIYALSLSSRKENTVIFL